MARRRLRTERRFVTALASVFVSGVPASGHATPDGHRSGKGWRFGFDSLLRTSMLKTASVRQFVQIRTNSLLRTANEHD